ncbi:hypothetical protein F3Y22_tig00110220pilonHSYRG00062 [Hibiscus syriacus]|uniref:Uncharacterized protein n=1 Tax=Hibiscus syriacus TaxID=106335 RepID=A0A6A3BDZ8_HIBSY|nr:hypothetical protein F3Y22_tig00110220pilonHSYRG00062 [Hibiscus syriacus]
MNRFGQTLKIKIAEIQRARKRRNPKKDQLFVEVPESRSFLDTATLLMVLAVAGIALFAKLLMMAALSVQSSASYIVIYG